MSDDPTPASEDTRLRVSCARCHRLHRVDAPLAFTPLCPVCAEDFPLSSLGMRGPHPLSHESITRAVDQMAPGNFALGFLDEGIFVVFRVGHSSSNLQHTLHGWVDRPGRFGRHSGLASAPWESHLDGGPLPAAHPARCAVSVAPPSGYTHFAFSYAPSAEAARAEERRNFIDFGGSEALDNPSTPDPEGPSRLRPKQGASPWRGQ